MINWYDRIGNRIEMKLYEDSDKPDFEWVKGNVIEGYRYRDGIVSMKSDDGRIIWCGVESGDFRKSEDSLGDFISNADRIRSMSDEELAGSRVDRIDFYTESDIPEYIGDFNGMANGIEEAIALEIKWLQSEVEEWHGIYKSNRRKSNRRTMLKLLILRFKWRDVWKCK